jgi:NAD(P)-dependent dehydrogenase (short-subunit alcohol dehydrogenase family)
LKGKVAVITGGASGIGRTLALRAADAGMNVALADTDERLLAVAVEQVRAKHVQAITVTTDVSDADSVRTLARRAKAELGPPWLVCCNSGVTKPKQDRKLSPEKLKTVVQTNLWNVINGVQVFVPEMVEHNAGHIVNIASAELLGVLGQALYVAMTHAIVGLSESLYRELDSLGSEVGVTVVCPALQNTNVTTAASGRLRPDSAEPATNSVRRVRHGVALSVFSPDELADEIFAALTARRFWLLPHRASREEAGFESLKSEPWQVATNAFTAAMRHLQASRTA